ncbi:retrovirus-related pol polyprotein from transposon TNT 1-94, partial [Tanacetum coccineum]
MCHILGIEPQFENIIKNGPFIPMTASQRKPEGQWIRDERKAANLDQRLKCLIMHVLLDDQMNSVIKCLIAKSTWGDLILYHEGPSDVKESKVIDLKLCYNTFKFKEGETLTQTFTRYKALMNELVDDGIKLSKLEINTGFINGLPKKWLSFCQSLRNTNHVKDSELAYLFGKLKYKENLIDCIYETKKNKSLVSATPLLTAFISTSIVKDFQDSPDDEEDTRSNHKYLNDLEEEYQARALLAKSKRFFMKDAVKKASILSFNPPFQPKPLSSSQHKPELRPTKDFKAKYNKVKAKMALLSSSASASKAVTIKNKGLIAEGMSMDEEEVSSDDNEMVEVKVLMALAEENDVVSKEGVRNGKWVKISMRKVHTLLEMEDNDDRKTYLDYLCIDLIYVEEQRNNILSKHIDLVHELNACKEQILVLKQAKLDFLIMQHVNTEILKNNKNLRIELKEITEITETWLNSSNKIFLAESQRNTTGPSFAVTDSSATEYDSMDESLVCSTPLPPLKKLDSVEPVSRPNTIKSILKSKSTLKVDTFKGVKINEPSSAPAKGNKSSSALKVNSAHAGKLKSVKIKDDPPLAILMKELNDLKLQISKNRSSYSIKRDINPRNSQHAFKRYESCGSSTHTTTDHCDIEWFKRGEALETKKVRALKSTKAESSNVNRSKIPTKSGCLRHMTSVKSYLHKYIVQPRPKVVFGDDSTCVTERYGSIKGQTLSIQCEKRNHHKAASKTKQTSSIKNCLHLLHMDLFGLVTPRSINHEKYTLVIVDEYSRYTRVYFLKKKSQAPETIMSFIKRVENENDIKVKQLRTDNGTEFRNIILVNFCDKKGIFQKISSPYTPEQNGVAERKKRTLIEAARTMLSGYVFSKQYWTEAVATACYTQNRSTIVKRHLKTPYEIFRKIIPNINFLHVFGCPVYIHNHKDHLEKFDEKANDGYLLGYSLVSKAFEVFNTIRQQTEETYHITFDESLDAIKLSRPLVDNINIAETGRYPSDEYLHPYEHSQ